MLEHAAGAFNDWGRGWRRFGWLLAHSGHDPVGVRDEDQCAVVEVGAVVPGHADA